MSLWKYGSRYYGCRIYCLLLLLFNPNEVGIGLKAREVLHEKLNSVVFVQLRLRLSFCKTIPLVGSKLYESAVFV